MLGGSSACKITLGPGLINDGFHGYVYIAGTHLPLFVLRFAYVAGKRWYGNGRKNAENYDDDDKLYERKATTVAFLPRA
jgi:hypothetical protein